MADTKKCPHCGQEIKAVAKKCRFCGRWLDEVSISATNTNISTPPPKSKYLLFGIGGIVIIAVLVWVVRLSVSDNHSYDNVPSYNTVPEEVELIEEVEEVPGNPIEEVPEYILTHDAEGNGVWVKNPDYVDGSHLYDGTEGEY